MEYRKFEYESDAIKEFINLPKRLYSKDTNTEDAKQMKELLLNKHILSKYFHLDKFLIYNENKVVGRFCITTYENDENAYIGYFECINDEIVAKFLFKIAYDFAKANGYKKIVGPVDSSFWIKYRLKINMFEYKPYTDEPYNKEYYYKLFLENNYKVIEHYTSRRFPIIEDTYYNGKFEHRYEEFRKKGYSIVSPNIKDYEKIIEELYYLITDLYSDFTIFKNLSITDFKEIFSSYKKVIRTEMIKMAYLDGKAVGFYISIPNYYNKVYHLNIINLLRILKLKKKPKEYVMLYMGVDREHTGLGKALVGAIEEELKKNKLPSIGALARDGKITQKYGEELSREHYEYVLMECNIYD